MIGEDRLSAYTDHLVAGRREACGDAISALLAEGHGVQEIYERVFRDSLYEVGRRWEAGEISVAVEHAATAITEDLLLRLLPQAAAREPCGRSAVVSAAAGEFHQVGARIVADTLEAHGWDVRFIGAGAPIEELLRAVVERPPDLLALSVSLSAHFPKAIATINRVREKAPRLVIVIGGRALSGPVPEELAQRADVRCLPSLGALEELVTPVAVVSDVSLDDTIAHCVRAELPALYLLLDAEDRIVEANRHTQDLFTQRLVGARFSDLQASFERDGQTGLARASDAPRIVNLITFTGLPQSFLCWFSRVGEQVAVLGGVDPKSQEALRRDLVVANQQLATTARELRRANLELTRLSTIRDTFFGMAAHDLRSPLTAILWFSELFAGELGASISEDQRFFLDGITSSAELMQGVVDGFLRMAIIGSGHLRINRAPASLPALVERALKVAEPAAGRKGVSIRLRVGVGIEPLSLDPPKIEQVVVNLVKNAVEHSTPGAEVGVDVARDGDHTSLCVRDRGAGIADEVRTNLFKSYTSADRTRGERSTGLGLAISKMVVEAHGGSIDVASARGEGTTFTVRLPAEAD